MGFFSNGWFFSNAGDTLDMKLALLQTFFCSSVPFLEFLIFSNGDLRNSNITMLVPLWVLTKRVSLYFSPWTFCFKTKQIQQHQISRKWENVVEEETEVGSWSRYIALASYKNINNNVTFHNRKKMV